MADAYVPVLIFGLPAHFVFDGRSLRAKVRNHVESGVVRVFAGPETVNVLIDIKRPYYRPTTTGGA